MRPHSVFLDVRAHVRRAGGASLVYVGILVVSSRTFVGVTKPVTVAWRGMGTWVKMVLRARSWPWGRH